MTERRDIFTLERIVDIAVVSESSDPEWDGKIITRLSFPADWRHTHGGLVVCDLVRHIALCFKVEEDDDVWEWVDEERYHHTTDIQRPS